MKKMTTLFFALSVVMTMSAQIDGFFPQFGQDAQWTVNDNFELVFAGAVAPAPAAFITTTGEGLLSDGVGNNDFTGLTIRFDGYIFDAATSTKVFLASDAQWPGNAVILEFNQWLCQAALNFAGYVHMLDNYPDYQSAVVKNGYNAIEINVSATGLIQCKVNNYVCNKPYQASLEALKPTALSTFYLGFANDITGFQMKNLVITKGDVTNNYFSDPEAGVDHVGQNKTSVYPNPSKGLVTISNESVGANYTITNVLGQKVQTGLLENQLQKINLSSINSGNYFLIIEGKNGKIVKPIVRN